MTVREQVLQRIPEITALPAAATRVLSLVQDPDVGISTIMETIEYDPVLTTEVLRLANTAYFAGPRAVESLRDAGVLFGTQRILQLVLATAVFPIAHQPLRGYDLPAGQLIRHSMAVAIGAEQLAELCGTPAPNHTFTSGLLSDIGKIVLGSFLEVDAAPVVELASTKGFSFEVAERQILGIDHAEVGALLLESWNVPENIIDTVRWHHDPDQSAGDHYAADLVHVASQLSAGFGLGGGVDGLNYRPSESAVARLKADHVMLERAACNMLVGLTQIQQQLPESS